MYLRKEVTKVLTGFAPEPQPALVADFSKLAIEWRKATMFEPSVVKKSMHPAYQRIMAMGEPAIPLILREMRERPGHWFWALQYLIQDQKNPAEECANIKEARIEWLKWGESKGYL